MLLAALTVALIGALLAAPAALAGVVTPQAEGPQAEDINTLYVLILVIAVVVFVGVEGLLFYTLFKYRARKGAVAAQIHGNTRLEVGWTVGAALILVVITAVTFIKLDDIVDPPASTVDLAGNETSQILYAATDQPPPPDPDNSLNIKVDGQQYVWRYQYPDLDGQRVFAYEKMVIPVGVTVTLDISSDDVAHSWWIPALGGKYDAVPGYINKGWMLADEEGTYVGQCAELCGRNHANMLASVVAVPAEEYQAWYERQARDIQAANRAAAEQRQEIEAASGGQGAESGGGAGGATGQATDEQ
jgi:cytochrome c oxidase subunit II